MRYSEAKNLFFVHIPKCAGLSVYRALGGIADFPWREFARDVGRPEPELRAEVTPFGFDHPELGPIHQAHLPLKILESHFPATFAALAASTSFAVVRDPRERFLSALHQHLREFEGVGALSITPRMLREAALRVVDGIAADEVVTERRTIHFARQSDYVMLSGRRVVDRLFPIEEVGRLEAWLTAGYGAPPFEDAAVNQSRAPARRLKTLHGAAKGAARLLPRPVRARLRPLWLRSGVYARAAEGYGRLDLGADVEAFVAARYAEDAALHAAALRAEEA